MTHYARSLLGIMRRQQGQNDDDVPESQSPPSKSVRYGPPGPHPEWRPDGRQVLFYTHTYSLEVCSCPLPLAFCLTPTHSNWSRTQPPSRNVILGICDAAYLPAMVPAILHPIGSIKMCKNTYDSYVTWPIILG